MRADGKALTCEEVFIYRCVLFPALGEKTQLNGDEEMRNETRPSANTDTEEFMSEGKKRARCGLGVLYMKDMMLQK